MGVVFEAQDEALQRKVALKVVRSDFATNREAVLRFLNEARAAATLKSEHVARVLDVGELDNGLPFMVMEHLEGADLAAVLQQAGTLPVHQAVDFVLQACEALAEAHKAAIIHRDLKPENLFVAKGPDGLAVIKVLDFGISKRLKGDVGNLTNPASNVGSPLYMSPEQMKSPSDVDARSDVWSIGAVLFQLLTGQSPYAGNSIPEICAKVLSQEPPLPRDLRPEIPEELELVVLRCLQKEPDDRFDSVAELATELEPFGSAQAALAARRVALIAGRPSLTPDPSGDRRQTDLEAILRASDHGLERRPSYRFGKRQTHRVLAGFLSVAAVIAGIRFVQLSGLDEPTDARAELASGTQETFAPLPFVPPPQLDPEPAAAIPLAPPAPSSEAKPASAEPPAVADEQFPTVPRVDKPRRRSSGSGTNQGASRVEQQLHNALDRSSPSGALTPLPAPSLQLPPYPSLSPPSSTAWPNRLGGGSP